MMNGILAGGMLLLAVSVAGAPPAAAQVCLDFVSFCDGLELTFDGDFISGHWRNLDCDGRDAPIWGIIRGGLPGPCHAGPTIGLDPQKPPRAGIACLPELGCVVAGLEWYFMLDELDGTLDAGTTTGALPPPGACSLDDLEYDLLMGPCAFGPESGGVPSTSVVR